MRTSHDLAAIAIAMTLGVSGLANASPHHEARPLAEGRFVLAPFSFTKFCVDYPDECRSGGPARVRLDAGRTSELVEVNRDVNASIVPTPDTSKFRFWALNATHGDCNEFAVQKRHDLLARGWPVGALALAVVKTSWGEGHLVLTVRTDSGDLVLDNLRSSIVPWERAGYRWVMRQSAQNPQYWASLDGGHSAPALPRDETSLQLAAAPPSREASKPAPSATAPSVARPDAAADSIVNSEPVQGMVRSGRGMNLSLSELRLGDPAEEGRVALVLASNREGGAASFPNLWARALIGVSTLWGASASVESGWNEIAGGPGFEPDGFAHEVGLLGQTMT